ncbi:hypothetical protein ADICYQ_1835 [Cyclobacterium qasimii M12-11B]|uniref:Uncharacterized protein n=1 Tax=Cyclobacterium qasimii M12-11B TaxID=641524 RepID=S7WYP6_9BACT|nr:hypothetical protein ADICYQ_1835 [Cyclobacterium qasimii M12-11B]
MLDALVFIKFVVIRKFYLINDIKSGLIIVMVIRLMLALK